MCDDLFGLWRGELCRSCSVGWVVLAQLNRGDFHGIFSNNWLFRNKLQLDSISGKMIQTWRRVAPLSNQQLPVPGWSKLGTSGPAMGWWGDLCALWLCPKKEMGSWTASGSTGTTWDTWIRTQNQPGPVRIRMEGSSSPTKRCWCSADEARWRRIEIGDDGFSCGYSWNMLYIGVLFPCKSWCIYPYIYIYIF